MAPNDVPKHDVEDSASAGKGPAVPKRRGPPQKGKGKRKNGGSSLGNSNPSSEPKTESSAPKSTPGFAEGNNVLTSYGLGLSGYRERILSPFKADKFFHFVEQSYQRLVEVKPGIVNRFTFEEFRHCSALQLYHRLEAVKFEALGVKPASQVRVPLPKNLRVFQPIWSVLANIGTVDDDELRVQYIPDSILPTSENLDNEEDISGLISCCMYDWVSSWDAVKKARSRKPGYVVRDAMEDVVTTNEPPRSKEDLISEIQNAMRNKRQAQDAIDTGKAKIIDGSLYYFRNVKSSGGSDNGTSSSTPSDSELKKTTPSWTPDRWERQVRTLMDQARQEKARRIKPKFDKAYLPTSYKISDGTINSDPGSYGSWLRWDPQLWMDYENFVNELCDVALFSLSMPVETTGTYAWILPVEKREDREAVFARLPKTSIPTQVWVLALLLQSSTLPEERRSSWYVETDSLANVLGLRQRYINAAVKSPSPVEQYGTT